MDRERRIRRVTDVNDGERETMYEELEDVKMLGEIMTGIKMGGKKSPLV